MNIPKLFTAAVAASLAGAMQFALLSLNSWADDTEIFYATAVATSSKAKPKVLIVIDDSGSMRTQVTTRPPYDPNETYNGGLSGAQLDRVYWSTSDTPPAANSNNWFSSSVNRCASSFTPLAEAGIFPSTSTRRWVGERTEYQCETIQPPQCPSGYTLNRRGTRCRHNIFWWITRLPLQNCGNVPFEGSWNNLSSSVHTPPHVDCEEDLGDPNEPSTWNLGNGPGQADGYPRDNVFDADVYTTDYSLRKATWGNPTYNLYSGHYVDYYNDTSLVSSRSRMEITQDVISSLLTATTDVDFGLAVFNDNGTGHDGGRIISRIIDNMTPAQRANLISIVENDLTVAGWTPLCESYYEVYRYLAGKTVLYGDNRDTRGTPDVDLPPRDPNAESSGTYIAPVQDCGPIYVIVMTDGRPSYDTNANSLIETLTGETCDSWLNDSGGMSKNCMPELSEYMSTQDINPDIPGDQLAITYTIGFDTSQALLEASATPPVDGGRSRYYEANDADTLTSAFVNIFNDIDNVESTFSSPTVAVDSFSRTRSLEGIYYSMFEPRPGPRPDWYGNIKKLRVSIDGDGNGSIVTEGGAPAFDPVTGQFAAGVSTYWSNGDGGVVRQGGVGALLAARHPSTRTIYTNTGSDGALEELTLANVTPTAFGLANDAELFNYFGVGSRADVDKAIRYAQGYSFTPAGAWENRARDWVMGDALHSRPRVMNYGGLGSFDEADPDLRIVVGTNTGLLHMFGDNDGQEDWAFFPKELAPILHTRRLNAPSVNSIYGLDLTPVPYFQDIGNDGTIDSSDGDKAWLYLGMRRGGSGMYALDVSSPGSPSLLWQIDPASGGSGEFGELGQTWSKPVITKIPGYVDGSGHPKPVAIFGAGYDVNKDGSGVGSPDSQGRGVFIVDAETGHLVRSITPAARTNDNLQAVGLTDSVAAEVRTMDSNADGLTDRFYFGDTGGNIWRVDMNLGYPNFPDGESWYVTKFAQLGSDPNDPVATDRRFFTRPTVVQIQLMDRPIDAVLIGTGDRTNPLAKDVDNNFYYLWDAQVNLYTTPAPTPAECVADPNDPLAEVDFRCHLPITQAVLPDSPLLDPNDADLDVNSPNHDGFSFFGWKSELTKSGEKNLADSFILDGLVNYTTYVPPGVVEGENACAPAIGDTILYRVDLYSGTLIATPFPPGILDTGDIFVEEDGGIGNVRPQNYLDPNGNSDGYEDLDSTFPRPYGNFWYREDY